MLRCCTSARLSPCQGALVFKFCRKTAPSATLVDCLAGWPQHCHKAQLYLCAVYGQLQLVVSCRVASLWLSPNLCTLLKGSQSQEKPAASSYGIACGPQSGRPFCYFFLFPNVFPYLFLLGFAALLFPHV